MKDILQNVYDELAVEKENLTETQFSEQYLGKCSSYFAYLKCEKKQPSADALLKLWKTLNRYQALYKEHLRSAQTPFHKQMLQDWVALHQKLSRDVFEVISHSP